MSQPRCEVIGDCTLWLGDCRMLMDQFDTSWAVVSDPPYGMAWDTDSTRFSGGQHTHRGRGRNDYSPVYGDTAPFDPTPWLGFAEIILWGANHYAQRLPVGTILVWLKRSDAALGIFLSDAELAWQKRGHGVYCCRDLSMLNGAKARQHPCEKPVSLMAWCVSRTSAETILDPYMGVASTALAALKLGRRFIGCEIDEKYHTIACRRIEAVYKQPDLFLHRVPSPAPRQGRLFAKEPTS